MCRTCRQNCRIVKFDFQCAKLYHDYVKSTAYSKPDLSMNLSDIFTKLILLRLLHIFELIDKNCLHSFQFVSLIPDFIISTA